MRRPYPVVKAPKEILSFPRRLLCSGIIILCEEIMFQSKSRTLIVTWRNPRFIPLSRSRCCSLCEADRFYACSDHNVEIQQPRCLLHFSLYWAASKRGSIQSLVSEASALLNETRRTSGNKGFLPTLRNANRGAGLFKDDNFHIFADIFVIIKYYCAQ